MKRYVAIEPTRDENSICLEVGYSTGGHNWWNGDEERRGYYLYCTPLQVETRQYSDGRDYKTFTQVVGKGNKLLLKEVARRSKKAETEAEQIALKKMDWLLSRVMAKYGLVFADVKKIFRTTDTELKRYNGSEVQVLRQLTDYEADEEVGKMYKIRFADGYERDAFEDELEEVKENA